MFRRQTGEIERDNWLSYLEKEKGLIVKKVRYCVYEINDKKVNIKFAEQRIGGTFWFNASPNYLNKMSVFVWLCKDWENYYVIPSKDMRRLINAGNYLSRESGYPSFLFRLSDHRYLPANINVESYYRNLSPVV